MTKYIFCYTDASSQERKYIINNYKKLKFLSLKKLCSPYIDQDNIKIRNCSKIK